VSVDGGEQDLLSKCSMLVDTNILVFSSDYLKITGNFPERSKLKIKHLGVAVDGGKQDLGVAVDGGKQVLQAI